MPFSVLGWIAERVDRREPRGGLFRSLHLFLVSVTVQPHPCVTVPHLFMISPKQSLFELNKWPLHLRSVAPFLSLPFLVRERVVFGPEHTATRGPLPPPVQSLT